MLETERTLIAPIGLEDAPFVVALVNSPDWLRYIGDRRVSDTEDARRYLEDGFLESARVNGFGYYVIRRAIDGVPMGICGFLNKPTLEYPDLGFALLPEYYGQGFAFEACRAVLDHGIRAFDFRVLDAVTVTDNVPSMRLLEKLEFQRLGIMTDGASELQLARYQWKRA